MTEDEAKTKWCPMARGPFFNGNLGAVVTTGNRTWEVEPKSGCLCLASDCMMWRWTRHPRTEPVNFREMADWDNVADAKGAGGCGLAGERT
jgi:hypothetical protein